MYSKNNNEEASSNQIGVVLLVAITVLLALIIFLMIQIPSFTFDMEKGIPVIFTITSLENIDELTGHMNYDSRLILLHTGKEDYFNKNLRARFLKNGQPVLCTIATMNGHDFISTSHTGVQWIGGSGSAGATWTPGEQICIDFSDGTFRPGDKVQMDIIDKISNITISRYMGIL